MHSAGLIFDESSHYIDHIAPFCALQKWPLIVCEGRVADLCRRYYPGLKVIEKNLWDLSCPKTIVSCYPAKLLEAAFPPSAAANILWLPHGNSDKGWKVFSFEVLQRETALVYGQKMRDFLKKKQVNVTTLSIGNFRLRYWMKHRIFYDGIVARELPPFHNSYLYAPTWNDPEKNGSFWEMFPRLAHRLPKGSSLIVKLHPNIERQKGVEIEQLKGAYESQKNIVFLPEFPPIYPLLNRCSAYIGDMSSIGYDFLYWNRPMYFLTKNGGDPKLDPSLYLHQCGLSIDPTEFISGAETQDLQQKRKEIYDYTFDRSPEYWFS